MIENRLILLLKKTKTLTQKFPSANPREWKAFSAPFSEHQSRFYSSFPRVVPASEHPVARSFIGYGLRSFLQNNRKKLYKPSFRNFCTSTSVNAKTTEGLKLLVTAGPKAQEAVGIWLFVSAAWLYSMVVLGGVSRLAKSGLSMTDWKFTGRLHPLSNDDWLIEFENYKQSSEYKRGNKEMSLDDFKFMYWMEYAHHLWGRALGILFVVPFSYFLLKGYITRPLGLRLSGLFALGVGQGLFGYWMTKSRSEESSEPRVSLYCFAVHLASAFAIYSGLFWTAVLVVMHEPPAESIVWVQGASKVKRLLLPVTILVGITSVSGAFVAGNDNGLKTGDAWVLEDNIYVLKRKMRNFFENTSAAQLLHGILAAASLISVGGLWWSLEKLGVHPKARPLIGSTIGIAAVQVALGTSSLVSNVPISVGTAHQGGTLTLLTLIILLNHIVRRAPLHGLSSIAKTAL